MENLHQLQGFEQIENTYVKNVYNQIAVKFDVTRTYYWACVKEFLGSIEKTPEKNLLDVGCGNGRYVKLFDPMQVYCLDNSEELLKIVSNRYPHVKTICSDVTTVPFSDESFDYIISIAVIHHLSSESRRIQMLEEIIRVLKVGGSAIITAWATSTPTEKFTKINSESETDSDYLIPWAHQYVRFYHLFKEFEFENILSKSKYANNVVISRIIFECDNWGIVIKKLNN